MKTFKILFSLLIGIVFFNYVLSQTESNIQLTEVEDNSLNYTINFQYNYSDIKHDHFILREYEFASNESLSGELKIPFKNILIAIPPGSNPKVNANIINKKVTNNIVPGYHPKAVKLNDSTMITAKADEIKKMFYPIIEVVGKGWYRNQYLLNLRIAPVRIDQRNSTIEEITSLSIELEFDNNIKNILNITNPDQKRKDDFLGNSIINYGMFENNNLKKKSLTKSNSDSWINYNDNYIKFAVGSDDIFRITKADLEGWGIQTNFINPKTFKIFESGNQIEIYVHGESNNEFEDGEYIEFWGHRNYSDKSARIINDNDEDYIPYLNRYTDSTYYYLSWGSGNGSRVGAKNSYNSNAQLLEWYTEFTHRERNPFDVFQFLNVSEVENQLSGWGKNRGWYWSWIDPSWRPAVRQDFSTSDIFPNKNGYAYAKVVSGGANRVNNAHNFSLRINGTTIDSVVANRNDRVLLSGLFNSTQLIDGNNEISAHSAANGVFPNFSALDWFEFEYPRYTRAIDDSLYMRIKDVESGEKRFEVENLSGSEFVVYKIDSEIIKFQGFLLQNGTLSFSDFVSNGDEYFVINSEKVKSPRFVKHVEFENFRNDNAQLDYIMVTHDKFYSKSLEYKDAVQSIYNVTAKVFSVDKIYDEFSFGYPYPEGIKDFIKYKFDNSAQPTPAYLLLIGDANYDYHKYRLTYGGVRVGENYVPSYGVPQSDAWYAIWDDAQINLPQLYVGRLPVNNVSDLDHYLNKLRNASQNNYDIWNKSFLLFSGGISESETISFRAQNDKIVDELIESYPIKGRYAHFYKTSDPVSDFGPYNQEFIDERINEGGIFISYLGHSGTATWDNSINNVLQLKNGFDKNPIISDFGCSTNKFAEPDIIAFGERFILNDNGQAIGYIGNSSLGFSSTSIAAPLLFYETIIKDSVFTIGQAHLELKNRLFSNFGNSNVFDIFSYGNLLMGDPIFSIKIPPKPDLALDNNSLRLVNENLTDQQDLANLKLEISNFGLVEQKSIEYNIKHSLKEQVLFDSTYTIPMTTFADTISFSLPINGKAGEHNVEIFVDPNSQINEIDENNNNVIKQFNVYATTLSDIVPARLENSSLSSINVLTPLQQIDDDENILYQVSETINFDSFNEFSTKVDSFFTVLNINVDQTKRYWVRYKLESDENWSAPVSFYNQDFATYALLDDESFNNTDLESLDYDSGHLRISSDSIDITVLSAGAFSGKTCVISKNGTNLLTNTFFAGLGIVVFDRDNLEVLDSRWYQLFGNSANVAACAAFIDSIEVGRLVAIGVADDAKNNMSGDLSNAIKSLGSTKIDQLVFKGPWAMIAVKGDPSFAVIEDVKGPNEDVVFLENTFEVKKSSGQLTTNLIGPTNNWQTIKLETDNFTPNLIEATPILIDKEGQEINGETIQLSSETTSLNITDPQTYQKMKLRLKLNSSGENFPIIKKLGVSYIPNPELGINFNGVGLSADSIIQLEPITFSFKVYNASDYEARDILVKTKLEGGTGEVRDLNYHGSINIPPRSYVQLEEVYENSLKDIPGQSYFIIDIDPNNSVAEISEENNSIKIPFFVEVDSTITSVNQASVSVMYDGREIYDGEYISSKPEIETSLYFPRGFDISDSSNIEFFMNGKSINYSDLQIRLDNESGQMKYIYKPELADGEHIFRVFGENVKGNLNNAAGYEKTFKVSNITKVLEVYNYPNPVVDETHFTFKLTNIPDELKIKIFTIAGRLIREIDNPTNLEFDFNKIHWDGKDEDGDLVGNGVYIYKIITKDGDENMEVTQKLAIVR